MNLGTVLPIDQHYTAPVVQAIVAAWRQPGQTSICNFCKFFGTAECPHNGKSVEERPEDGFSDKFCFKATSDAEANALFADDAALAGKPFMNKAA